VAWRPRRKLRAPPPRSRAGWMTLRLAASEANLLIGCGHAFAHSVTRSPAAAANSPTGRGDKQLEQLRKEAGVVASIVAIVKHDQALDKSSPATCKTRQAERFRHASARRCRSNAVIPDQRRVML